MRPPHAATPAPPLPWTVGRRSAVERARARARTASYRLRRIGFTLSVAPLMSLRSSVVPLATALGTLLCVASAPAQAPVRVLGEPVQHLAALAAPSPTAGEEGFFGRSGALRAAILRVLDTIDGFVEPVPGAEGRQYRWVPLFGTRTRLVGDPVYTGELRAPASPGIWRLDAGQGAYASAPQPLTFITQVPFSQKRGGRLNGYHIGSYPAEGSGRADRYAPPAGFIEVTPENQDLPVSEHFRLRQFLTKDQRNVWPKYLVLDLKLIDKLELVLQELNAMGVRADRFHVMSGYRTPQYNGPGGDGRAKLSRHTYGDAADVWVDNDANGYMDDLNGDGRVDIRDAQVMLRAVDRVEAKYPDLVGGAGLYAANSAHGPFIHIDTRGSRARW